MRFRPPALLAPVLVGGLLHAAAAQPPDATKPASAPPADAAPKLSAKAFKLERAAPADVRAALGQLLGPADRPVPSGGPLWRVTDSERAKAVIVRGTDRHLKIAADAVAVLDRAADAPLPKTEAVRTLPLSHVKADAVQETFHQLAYDQTRLWPASDKLVLLVGPDDEAKEIADWVKAIDVEAKSK